MNKYIYTDHNEEIMIFTCIAKDIMEADSLFFKQTGLSPQKLPYVGCSILKGII